MPGWSLFLGAADGSYVMVSYDAIASTVDLDMSNSSSGDGIETAFSSRPAVVAGNGYSASLTYDNSFAPAGAEFYIDWFGDGAALLNSSGGSLGDPNGPLGYDPYTQLLTISGIAPAGVTTAGVRLFSASSAYSGLTADNFTFSADVPVPIPAAAWLLLSGAGAIAAMARRQGSGVRQNRRRYAATAS